MNQLFVGADVHYVLEGGPHAGECRPAKVLRVHPVGVGGRVARQAELGLINGWSPATLAVFCLDGKRDGANQDGYTVLEAVRFSGELVLVNHAGNVHDVYEYEPGTWHFVPLCVE